MTTLAGIEHEIENILAVAEELDDGQQEQALDYLDALAFQEAEKIDAISYAVRKRQAHIAWLAGEEARIRARRQSMERRLEEFRAYLVFLMQRHGLARLKGNVGALSLRRSERVEIVDQALLPDDFLQVLIEERPKKSQIREALAAGVAVPGACLVEGVSVTIR